MPVRWVLLPIAQWWGFAYCGPGAVPSPGWGTRLTLRGRLLMSPACVRVVFEHLDANTSVPDLIAAAGGTLAGAVGDCVIEYHGNAAFTLHFADAGGWIDAGSYNAGRFTLVAEPAEAVEDMDGQAEEIDPWLFPPAEPRERRSGDAGCWLSLWPLYPRA